MSQADVRIAHMVPRTDLDGLCARCQRQTDRRSRILPVVQLILSFQPFREAQIGVWRGITWIACDRVIKIVDAAIELFSRVEPARELIEADVLVGDSHRVPRPGRVWVQAKSLPNAERLLLEPRPRVS